MEEPLTDFFVAAGLTEVDMEPGFVARVEGVFFANPLGKGFFFGCIRLAKSSSSASTDFLAVLPGLAGVVGASTKLSSSRSPHASGSLSSLSSSPRKFEGGLASGWVNDLRKVDGDDNGDDARGVVELGTPSLWTDGSDADLPSPAVPLGGAAVLFVDSSSPTAEDSFFVKELIAQPAQLSSDCGVPMRGTFAVAIPATPSVTDGGGRTVSG